jgi:hypothetical protein
MTTALETMAARLDEVAGELERAARHASVAARHFRDKEVPRACAHTLAVEGHLSTCRRLLDEIAVAHAAHAQA